MFLPAPDKMTLSVELDNAYSHNKGGNLITAE